MSPHPCKNRAQGGAPKDESQLAWRKLLRRESIVRKVIDPADKYVFCECCGTEQPDLSPPPFPCIGCGDPIPYPEKETS